MEICTGIRDVDTLKKYIAAGATEFYCGMIDDNWLDTYDYVTPINRRPWPEANFSNFYQLEEAVRIAHANGCRLFYTLNEHCYSKKQFPIIAKHVEKLIAMNTDAIIFSDLSLIKYIIELNFSNEIHISTGGIAFNNYAVKFYKEQFGAKRIILPRVLLIQEINEIANENKDMDFEIFIKNEGCTYIDGLCNFVHGVQFIPNGEKRTSNPPCELRYQVKCSSEKNPAEPVVLESRLDKVLGMKGNCGICSLYLFNRARIKSLKIVSRDTDPDSVVMDIKKVKESIRLCDEIDDFMEFKKRVRLDFCKNEYKKKHIFCYYSEVIRDEI